MIKQSEVHLGDAAGGHMAKDFGEKPGLQSPIGWDAEIHREIAGERKFSCEWVTEGLQITQVGQRPEDLLQLTSRGPTNSLVARPCNACVSRESLL